MRWSWLILGLVLAGAARGQGKFKGATKVVRDAEERVAVTVPEAWQVGEPADGQLLSLSARYGGGHNLIVVREAGQADVDKQRDRYLEYDSGNYPGAEIKKYAKPFFGYRLNHPQKNRVLLRRFLTDGSDGLVITISSRFRSYDAVYADQNLAVIASVTIASGGGGGTRPELAGTPRRLFGKRGVVSVVAPGAWRPLEPDEEEQLLFLGLKGARSGPTITLYDHGGPTNPNLVLITLSNRWKKSYGNITRKRLGARPPALLVRNRKPGWADYIIAFGAGSHGYTLRLSVREGSFERFKPLLDDIAKSVVLIGGPYRPAQELPGDITVEQKRDFVVHARAEESSAADRVARELGGFSKSWSRIGVGRRRKPSPIHVVIVDDASFEEKSHGFGERPAAYDRLSCAVVVVKPPADDELVPGWRGRLYAALAEAALHRDLSVATPPWLLAGLTTCMDAAGRTGQGAQAAHPALVTLLDTRTATDSHAKLQEVLAYTYGDVFSAATPDRLTMAWGYTHLMLFGKTPLSATFKKWVRALEKAKRAAPPFEVGRYDKAEEDLKRHVFRNWGK